MAVIVNGDGILTGISSLATALTDITSGRGTITGVTTVGTLQLGAGVSISSPRTQTAAIFTNNTEFLTIDDAGRVGVGTITPNSDVHPQNVGKINVGFITARSVAGDIDANTMVVAGISTFAERTIFENNLTITSGTLTMSTAGNIVLGDSGSASSNRIRLGDGDDLSLFHDSNRSAINNATGELRILSGSDVIIGKRSADDSSYSEQIAAFKVDGAVELYHDDTKMFETRSGGTAILNGDLLLDSDSHKLKLGLGADLNIYHNGSHSFIDNDTGTLYLQTATNLSLMTNNNEDAIQCIANGAVNLYYDNVKIFETMSSGCKSNIAGANTFTIGSSDASGAYLVLDGDSNGDGTGADYASIIHGTDGDLSIHADNPAGDAQFELYTGSGSTTAIVAQAAGEVQLYHNGTQKLITLAGGAEVFGSLITENSGAGSGTSEIQLQPYGTDGYINCTASGNLYTRMGTGYTIRTRIDSNGHFHVSSGNLVIDTAGQGIDFSSTSDGSGTDTSELLDDYEEGTWTPVWAPSVGSFTSLSYSVQLGKYVKIGNLVTAWVHTTITSVNTSGASGSLRLTGLPYAAGSGTVGDGGSFNINYYSGMNNMGDRVMTGYTAYGNSFIVITKVGGGSATGIAPTDLGNGHCYGCVSYNIG